MNEYTEKIRNLELKIEENDWNYAQELKGQKSVLEDEMRELRLELDQKQN